MEEQLRIIEQLRDSLSNINSARKQVDETVAAYKGAENELGTLAGNMRKIENALSDLVSVLNNKEVTLEQQSATALTQLQNACEKVIDNTKHELSSVSQGFKTSTKDSIKELDAAVKTANTLKGRIETTIEEISKLVDGVSKLQKELKSSQSAQDKAINKISVSVSNITNTLSTHGNTLAQLNQTIQSYFEKLQMSEMTNKKIIIISTVIIVVVQLVLKFI